MPISIFIKPYPLNSPKLFEKYWFDQKYYRHKQVEVRECCKTKTDTVKDLENSDENGKASTCSNFLESRNQTTEIETKGLSDWKVQKI